MSRLGLLIPLVVEICKQKGWSLEWDHRGVYLHLEASELIEAIRHKRGVGARKEAGDLLFTFVALLAHNGINFEDAVDALNEKITELDPLNDALHALSIAGKLPL